jgi:hypothetical protein
MKRSDVKVTMDYWIGGLSGKSTASLTVRKVGFLGSILAMDSVVAEIVGNEPQTIPPHGPTGRIPYPSYEVLTAGGLVEIVEQENGTGLLYQR